MTLPPWSMGVVTGDDDDVVVVAVVLRHDRNTRGDVVPTSLIPNPCFSPYRCFLSPRKKSLTRVVKDEEEEVDVGGFRCCFSRDMLRCRRRGNMVVVVVADIVVIVCWDVAALVPVTFALAGGG